MASVLFGAAGISIVLSLALTWTVRQLARRRGWMASPVSRRHIHKFPVPRLGGVAVFLSIAATLLVSVRYNDDDKSFLIGALLPAAWMLAVGLTDDMFGFRARAKLAAQILGGVAIFCVGIRIPAPEFLGASAPVAISVSLLLTTGWTVAVMNSINLVDGLDGLASGTSLCIVSTLLALAVIAGHSSIALLGAATAGSIIGFLFFNTYPASIFLGDSGSLVLGTVISIMSVRLIAELPMGWLACPVLLAHPFSEVVLSVTRRFLRADPIFCPDRRHLHHRLMDRGLTHPQAAAALVLSSVVSSVLAVFISFGGFAALGAIILGASGAVLAVVELRYREFTHFYIWLRKTPQQRGLIASHMRLEELSRIVPTTRSLTELRIALSEGFVAMGFENARLRVRSYEGTSTWGQGSSTSVSMLFPLHSAERRLGNLELCWNVQTGRWPFDPEFFAAEFLDVLSRQLERFVHLNTALPQRTDSVIPPGELLPRLAVESGRQMRVPLNS